MSTQATARPLFASATPVRDPHHVRMVVLILLSASLLFSIAVYGLDYYALDIAAGATVALDVIAERARRRGREHRRVAQLEDLVDHLGLGRRHVGLRGLELEEQLELLARDDLPGGRAPQADRLDEDEVDARRSHLGGPIIPDALRVVVDGFTASEIGATQSANEFLYELATATAAWEQAASKLAELEKI